MNIIKRIPSAVGLTGLCLLLFTACGANENSRALRFKDFTIEEFPAKVPAELPPFFVPAGAVLIKSGVYKTGPFSAPEGVVVLESPHTPEALKADYEKRVVQEGWQIIQSQDKPGEQMLMAEDSAGIYLNKKLVTIVLRQGTPTRIKIYFKRTES